MTADVNDQTLSDDALVWVKTYLSQGHEKNEGNGVKAMHEGKGSTGVETRTAGHILPDPAH